MVKHINLLLICLFLTACSGPITSIDPKPLLVTDAAFPFFNNDSLYNFNPETGSSEKLVHSNRGLIIGLDTDKSVKDTITVPLVPGIGNTKYIDHNVFKQTILPEKVVYVVDESVHLYDLHTRHDHTLIDFKITDAAKVSAANQAAILAQKANDAASAFDADELLKMRDNIINEAKDKQVCDIRKSIILDRLAREEKKILLKDENKIYLKTSLLGTNCTDPNTPFEFFSLNIVNSLTKTFTVHRDHLKEHDHKSKHAHLHTGAEGGDHTHTHAFADGQLDDNGIPFDIHNHLHSHIVTHDLLYGDLEAHKHLTKAEIDAVHNNPKYHEILSETHPVLIGKKWPIDEALMYSGKPIIDIANNRYGYLGFNSTESSYKFYLINLTTLEKKFLWQMTDNQFSINRIAQSKIPNSDLLQPDLNRHRSYSQSLSDGITLIFNSKLVKWTLLDLFDDDMATERQFRIDNPLFKFTNDPSNSAVTLYTESINNFIINDKNKLYQLSNTQGSTPRLLNVYKDTAITHITPIHLIESNILTLKNYSDGSKSITNVNSTSALETTLQEKTFGAVSETKLTNAFGISTSDTPNLTIRTQHYNSSLTPRFTPALTNAILALTHDYQLTKDSNIKVSEALYNSTSSLTINGVISLSNPSIYQYDNQSNNGQGRLIGTVPAPASLTGTERIVILNDQYGFININDPLTLRTSTYFFPPGLTSFNPTGQFGDMKFMYMQPK